MMYQKWQPNNVMKMHREPLQANIILAFDVPAHRRQAAEQMLENAMHLAAAAIQSAMTEGLSDLDIHFCDSRVDWD